MNLADLLRRLFYIRYPVLCLSALLLVGPIAALTGARELLANTLLVHTFWQSLALTIICLTGAKLFLVQAGVTLFNAPDRFSELLPAPAALVPGESRRLRIWWGWSLLKTLFWLAAGLTLPLTAVGYSASTRGNADELGGFSNTVDWTTGLSGVVSGAFVDLCLLLLVAFVERWLVSASATIPGLLPIRVDFPKEPDPRLWRVDRLLARVVRGRGYTDPPDEDGNIYCRPGHWQQFVVLGFVIAAYMLLRALTVGSTARPDAPLLPTLFFAILELSLISTVLAGASFFLDYYRIPALLVLVLALALSFAYSERDYTFPTPKSTAPISPPKLLEVVGAKTRSILADKSGKRTLVVVTAPGGGIHAAVWTAQVLSGLHYRYGEDYARSLFLISAVSGGSVGTMYYAANFNVLQDPGLQDAGHNAEMWQHCRSIVERAGGSGLEAVGWGLVFEDLPAAVPFVHISGNRGKTLDQCWEARLDIPGQKNPLGRFLGDWRQATVEGKLPVVVFNATEVESGRRMLFSPVYSERRKSLSEKPESEAAPVEFSRTFGRQGYDVGVTTAARLSATFPYVTPTATSENLNEMGHMADGGYADNEGIETAVDWISKLIDQVALGDADPAPFDRVLILRIRHQVPADPLKEADQEQKKHARDGFQFAAFGPLKTVLTVRGASQVERGQVEVDFLRDVPEKIKGSNHGITIESAYLDFKLDNKDQPPPLSWKLSPQEFVKYQKAWDTLKTDAVIQELDRRYFAVKRP